MKEEIDYVTLQTRALGAVQKAKANGLIPHIDENTKCTDCGKPAVCYDHRDYLKPLDVQPVCSSCNSRRGPTVNAPPKQKVLPLVPVTRRITFRIPEELVSKVEALCEQEYRSLNTQLIMLIEKGLKT